MISLRPYQAEGIRAIFDAWNPLKQNLMNVLFQMPTGTGKTTVFSEIVRRARLKDRKVLTVVHRKELVEQIAERLSHFGVSVGIISGTAQPDAGKEVQVATIQTLSKRCYPQADIVIIDECHHAKASTYVKLWENYPDARILGVTATPIRMSGEGFSDLFDTLITSLQLSEFVKAGYLVKVRHIVGVTPNLSSVKIKMNDYAQDELGELMQSRDLMADLVESYQRRANGKKMIAFAVNIKHSKKIVENYRNAGIQAEHIDANTPKKTREHILQLFREGEIKVLGNVDIVSEGFDVPDCEAVQLARPTKSLGLYLQQVGRCMRPSEGKEEGIVLDNAGLWLEHGLCQQDRTWSLKGKKKQRRKRDEEIELAAIDENEVIHEIRIPEEIKGMELIEPTKEIEELLIFERFVSNSIANNYKPLSAYYRFIEYMEKNDSGLNRIHLQYIQNRLSKLFNAPKKGFWYHEERNRIFDS